ncbi:glycosyl transferase [Pseudomonas aeruginosa]|nr:sugar transferase [Pseudomonas aeruginosa]SUD17347.1 glycosyl transferase [Pseudomonas aeruginosa]
MPSGAWLCQTRNHSLHKIKKRVEYDLEYIAKWSVWFDLYILFRTVPAVLLTKEVY